MAQGHATPLQAPAAPREVYHPSYPRAPEMWRDGYHRGITSDQRPFTRLHDVRPAAEQRAWEAGKRAGQLAARTAAQPPAANSPLAEVWKAGEAVASQNGTRRPSLVLSARERVAWMGGFDAYARQHPNSTAAAQVARHYQGTQGVQRAQAPQPCTPAGDWAVRSFASLDVAALARQAGVTPRKGW